LASERFLLWGNGFHWFITAEWKKVTLSQKEKFSRFEMRGFDAALMLPSGFELSQPNEPYHIFIILIRASGLKRFQCLTDKYSVTSPIGR
jgi:hypothetical protein